MLNGWAWPMVPPDYLILSSEACVDHVVCWKCIGQVYRRTMGTLDLTKVGGRLTGTGGGGDEGGEEESMGCGVKEKKRQKMPG